MVKKNIVSTGAIRFRLPSATVVSAIPKESRTPRRGFPSGPYPAARAYFTWNINHRHGLRVLLAPLSYTDTATFDDPHRVSTGIERVVVNGRVAYYNGQSVGPRSGRFLPIPHSG